MGFNHLYGGLSDFAGPSTVLMLENSDYWRETLQDFDHLQMLHFPHMWGWLNMKGTFHGWIHDQWPKHQLTPINDS
jgi:hypothetical protein